MVQTRAQKVRTGSVRLSGNHPPHFMRDGPTSLKPRSSQTKRTRKRKKTEDLTLWPLDELFPNPPKSRAATKTATKAASKVEKTPTAVPNKSTAALNTGKMTTPKNKDSPSRSPTPSTGSTTTGSTCSSIPSLPKELIEQYTLRVRPQPGASLEEIEKTIRSRIESPCGNLVWGSSHMRKPTALGGAATLEMDVIYHNCSREGPVPLACRRMHIVNGHGGSRPHEPLGMGDVVLLVSHSMPELVASCEAVGERSWAVNAISSF